MRERAGGRARKFGVRAGATESGAGGASGCAEEMVGGGQGWRARVCVEGGDVDGRRGVVACACGGAGRWCLCVSVWVVCVWGCLFVSMGAVVVRAGGRLCE